MTDPMTDPKIIAELRELIDLVLSDKATPKQLSDRLYANAVTLLADSERLRLAVEGLEDISEGDPFRNLPHIARDTISRLEIRST